MGVKGLTFLFLTQIHKELEELRERNKSLEEIAGQAEYFASLYQVLEELRYSLYLTLNSFSQFVILWKIYHISSTYLFLILSCDGTFHRW